MAEEMLSTKNVFQIAKTKSEKSKTQMKNNCHI